MFAHKPKKSVQILKYAPYLALLLATAIWGAAVPIAKLTLNYIPTFSLLFIRFLVVCMVVLVPLIIELRKTPINSKDLPSLILLGLTGQSGIIFVFMALSLSTTVDIALIGAIAPLLIILAGHYFYNERVTQTVKIGVLIATAGTLLIVLEPIWSGYTSQISPIMRILGNLLAVLYNVTFAIYIIVSKRVLGQNSKTLAKLFKKLGVEPMTKRYSPFVETALSFYVALITTLPLALAENMGWFGNVAFSMQSINWVTTAGILYMAIFSSIVAYIAFEWGLKKARATDSAVFGYLSPLFTLPLAFLLLGEIPTATALVGSIIIALGVIIAETKKS